MKISDHIELSFANLWNMKLRTTLTTIGVMVGIGALVSMVSLGLGMQRNITDSFNSLELFNSVTVLPQNTRRGMPLQDQAGQGDQKRQAARLLDEKAAEEISRLRGVELVFPDIRFPAKVRFNGGEDFKLVQALPAKVTSSKLLRILAGKPFQSDDGSEVIVSSGLLRQFKVANPASVVGERMELSSIAIDPAAFNPMNWPALLQGGGLTIENHSFIIAAVTEGMGMEASGPTSSDVYIPTGSASKVYRLPFTNIWDLFGMREGRLGYSALNVRLASPGYIDSVKAAVQQMGFSCFALADQFRQIKTSFYFLDMVLAAVGMVAIFVASLGIINTMVMSILERYSEIGIMKAVGASDTDVKKIFFFESSSIGFMGGIFGLGLGWSVSRLINLVVNYFLAKQGIPYVDYFHLPLWLCLGAIAFSIAISLVSGIYPAVRAARIDPVVALRHD